VLALIDEGRPLTEIATTDRFMLNVPLMVEYAFIDTFPRNDDLKPIENAMWLLRKHPNLTFLAVPEGPIPLAESIDPKSPNFMKWHVPAHMKDLPRCREAKKNGRALFQAATMLQGGPPNGCGDPGTDVFTAEDWDTWRMVRIRPPAPDEERTIFWDVPKLRDPKTTELVLAAPRAGFMTTLAFFANWPTNISNSYRVTTNQALIVGLGTSFDDANVTVQVNETSVDAQHVELGTVCFGCHQTLDPMRDFFRHSFSVAYSTQLLDLTAAKIPQRGTFAVEGARPTQGTGIAAFAKAMADHPLFATAWTQKLCQFANSASCSEDDPEFERVAKAFSASKFNFKLLTRELFSSPLVTFARATKTAEDHGVVIGISRRNTLCAALASRLGIADACGEIMPVVKVGVTPTPMEQAQIRVLQQTRNLAVSVPGAGYARGDAKPLLPHDPSMFFSSATENLCWLLSQRLVDSAGSRYTSAQKDEALSNFTVTLMGLPDGHPHATESKIILEEHHAAALQAGASPTNALRSAFTLACQSPFTTSLGL
jgi:hypothetical protein